MHTADHSPPWRPRLQRPTTSDLAAAVTVALILIPQSLAYAVIAGMPPAVGLTVGAVATIAAAPFVSSPFLQTGPVAITALLTFGGLAGIAEAGSDSYVRHAALLALLVGLIRLGIGIARAGSFAYLMSRPVLDAFTPAAAIVIALSQLPTMLGVSTSGRGLRAVFAVLLAPGEWNLAALGLGALTVALVLGSKRLHPLVPGVLLSVVAGMVVAAVAGLDVPVIGSIPDGLPTPSVDLPWLQAPVLVVPALVIALVGFAEPAAIARTYAEETRSRWDPDREFVSQGTANLASGLFGGFPVGGSFSRSAVAREAGARSSWAGLFTGLLVLAALPFVGVLATLPDAVLAGVIFASVLSLIKVQPLLDLRRWSRQQTVVATTTFVLTIALAPQIQYGIIAGVVLSIGGHLRRELEIQAPSWVEGTTLHLRPLGVLYFGSAHRLEDQLIELLGDHPEIDSVVLHMDRLGRVDVTGALALESMLDRYAEAGVTATVKGLTPTGTKIVSRVLRDAEARVDVHDIEDVAAH